MGTDLQEAKLMRQEADILRTCYYQDWVWHEYWTLQSKLTLWFMFFMKPSGLSQLSSLSTLIFVFFLIFFGFDYCFRLS